MFNEFLRADDGMTTVEYVVGTLAAATFALVLLAVIKSKSVSELLRSALEGAFAGT